MNINANLGIMRMQEYKAMAENKNTKGKDGKKVWEVEINLDK